MGKGDPGAALCLGLRGLCTPVGVQAVPTGWGHKERWDLGLPGLAQCSLCPGQFQQIQSLHEGIPLLLSCSCTLPAQGEVAPLRTPTAHQQDPELSPGLT